MNTFYTSFFYKNILFASLFEMGYWNKFNYFSDNNSKY